MVKAGKNAVVEVLFLAGFSWSGHDSLFYGNP